MSIIIAVAPHPDDETLGCGGTLLRHGAEGDDIHWLIMTGITEEAGFGKEQVASRQNEVELVAKAYGFSCVHQAGFVTTELHPRQKRSCWKKFPRCSEKLSQIRYICSAVMMFIMTMKLCLMLLLHVSNRSNIRLFAMFLPMKHYRGPDSIFVREAADSGQTCGWI